MSDIAKKAGIARGVMYHYFHSKEEVMDAMLEQEYADIIAACQQKLDKCGGNAPFKLALLLNSYRSSYVDASTNEYLHLP